MCRICKTHSLFKSSWAPVSLHCFQLFRLTGIHKKNVELSLMLVPRCKGLRIAHLSRNRATFTTPRRCKKYDGLTG